MIPAAFTIDSCTGTELVTVYPDSAGAAIVTRPHRLGEPVRISRGEAAALGRALIELSETAQVIAVTALGATTSAPAAAPASLPAAGRRQGASHGRTAP